MTDHSSVLPAVPMKDSVLFPRMVMTMMVSRQASLQALAVAETQCGSEFILVSQRSPDNDSPTYEGVYPIGVRVRILQAITLPDESVKCLLEGIERVEITTFDCHVQEGYHVAFSPCEQTPLLHEPMWQQSVTDRLEQYLELLEDVPKELTTTLNAIDDLTHLLDAISAHLPIGTEDKQAILAELSLEKRVERVIKALAREIVWLKVQRQLDEQVKEDLKSEQFKAFQESRLRLLKALLGEDDKEKNHPHMQSLRSLAEKLAKIPLTKSSQQHVLDEFRKLQMMQPYSAEATLIQGYLDWIIALPWKRYKSTKLSLSQVKEVLDQDHYGLKEVKTRIIEQMAVRCHYKKASPPLLCLVGPPGVGKTSLGESIAKAMGRPFARIALGGVRDEAEIRGHRKTYVGAMPGRILRVLKQVGVANPVILLDEIDKMAMDHRGDPASALLEVLDPEQNKYFTDHFLEIPFDLSRITFIVTANSLHIPPALKDRLEIIRLEGYTEREKLAIARQYLFPKALKKVGLPECLPASNAVFLSIIRHYTQEAGVRECQRQLEKIARKMVTRLVEGHSAPKRLLLRQLNSGVNFLGSHRFQPEVERCKPSIGRVMGLAWTAVGGDVLMIEVSFLPGKGQLTITGHLGEVMKESIQAALSVVRARSTLLTLPDDFFKTHDMHCHVPEGATPKEGPSAGIAIALAIASAATKITIPNDLAMTGEVTLHGHVLAIGGVKEKLLAAQRVGVNTVFLPSDNARHVVELDSDVTQGLTIQYLTEVDTLFKAVLFPHSVVMEPIYDPAT